MVVCCSCTWWWWWWWGWISNAVFEVWGTVSFSHHEPSLLQHALIPPLCIPHRATSHLFSVTACHMLHARALNMTVRTLLTRHEKRGEHLPIFYRQVWKSKRDGSSPNKPDYKYGCLGMFKWHVCKRCCVRTHTQYQCVCVHTCMCVYVWDEYTRQERH